MSESQPYDEGAVQRSAVAAQVLGGEDAATRASAAPVSTGIPGEFGPKGGAHLARTYSRDPEAFPPLDSRQELWRFSALPRLRAFASSPAADGEMSVDWSEGAPVERVPMSDPRVGRVHTPFERVGAVAMQQASQALVVTITEEHAEPVVLTAKGLGGTSYGHLVVDVAPFAKGVVVVDHVGTGRHASNVELRIGDGASLTFVTVADWDDDAVHVEAQTALLGRDARLRHVAATFGGNAVRLLPKVCFGGTGGDAELLGLFFVDAGQHVDNRLLIEHEQAHCRSRVTYKGALQGEDARSVWTGDVFIRPSAEGTDTYELNRNLLLTDGARADSVPNLEIETGEVVGAGHASATGRFDDDQLFYLMARGIPRDQARRLVVRGFFADLVERVGLPWLTDRLLATIDAELERAIA